MPVYENHAIIFQLFPSQKGKSQIISYWILKFLKKEGREKGPNKLLY